MSALDKQWERIQQKTFTKWCNMHLGKRGQKIEDISKDFCNGLYLISMLEIIGAEDLGKHNKNPKMRIHNIENVNKALGYIASKGVKLWGISSEDICDGNLKLTLGMVWTIILRFAIADISEEELSAKEALLLWCKKKTAGYSGVDVTNFSTSWQDGLAFCALIAAHRPDLIDYSSLNHEDKAGNLQLAFNVAEKDLGIPQLLDVEDVLDVPKPDERSVMAYVAQYYHVFSANRKQEIAGRRIGKLVDMTLTNDELKADYSTRAEAHTTWVKSATEKLGERDFPNGLDEIKVLLNDHSDFKTVEKPPKLADRLALEALHNTIQVKLSNANRPTYVPPEGQSPKDIAGLWDALDAAQQAREDALLAELARQQKLDLLKRRFKIKADQLEEWIGKKKDYLQAEEPVGNVDDAQRRLKNLEAFLEEYEATRPRLAAMNGVKDEIVGANDPDSDSISARAAKIDEDFNGLKAHADSKRADLDSKLQDQNDKEALRKRFAKAAKAYNFWAKETISAVAGTSFPDSLAGCEAFAADLDSGDADCKKSNDEKKAELDGIWAEEQAAGITDNRYTVFTDEDVAALHKSVEDSLAKRREEYATELARQAAMEEKRKEFAAAAEEFTTHVDARKGELDTTFKGDGEPADVKAALATVYAEGAAENEKLGSLRSLQDEMGKMGISENSHTKHTVPTLEFAASQLGRFVRNKNADLDKEASQKNKYNSEAKQLVDWVAATQPTIGGEFDNTLEGVRAAKVSWNEYKTTDRAARGVQRINLEALFKKIQTNQTNNGRPAFTPAEGLSLESIASVWSGLEEAEKNRENEIETELARQEKLFSLNKQFNSEADELEAWAAEKEAYLGASEEVGTLDDARLKIMHLDVFDEDMNASLSRVENIKGQRDEIVGLNYHRSDDVNARVAAIEALWEKLSGLAKSKRETLDAARSAQQDKEGLRLDYASKADRYVNFAKNSVDNLDDHFGTTLEDVVAHKAKMDADSTALRSTSTEKKAAAVAAAEALKAAGVEDNRHTTTTTSDLDASEQALNDALAKRDAAYEEELKRQQANDEERKQFAELANAFVAFLDEQGAAMKSAATGEGSPAEKTEKVKAIHQDGAPNKAKLDEITVVNEGMQSRGIFTNSYTPHTAPSLEKRNKQYNDNAANLLSFIEEEQQMLDREAVQQEEWNSKQEMEQQRIDFDKLCRELILYLDSIYEDLTDPINVDSVEEIEALISRFNTVKEELDNKQADYDQLVAKHAELTEMGIPASLDETTAKWNDAQEKAAARRAALDAELARQKENDALCRSFAEKAGTADQWVNNNAAILASDQGTIEEQLANLSGIKTDEGSALLADLESIGQQITAAGVQKNPHTEFSVPEIKSRLEELENSLTAKISLLEKERLAKQHSTASPEQIEEFKEVFRHFDKNHTNTLSRLEFKSCLQSLGEDPADGSLDGLMKELGTLQGESYEIGFDKFLEYMIQITSDHTTENEIYQAFRDLAGDKDFITADDLRRGGMPAEKVDYLTKEMPPYKDIEGAFDYKTWANAAFNR